MRILKKYKNKILLMFLIFRELSYFQQIFHLINFQFKIWLDLNNRKKFFFIVKNKIII